ncbi:Mechanosensitive channel MscK [Alteripontixanthobacter maritimus]|uniref:Mechanosensitive channel MscK n=1 Tax=Alteripontixanthobacter maritimus TaxID=2161824 RepID=A0A369Q8W9_9SPHN|nr:mechanosensitive ion channel domain-containing protein [Alteripontixanthobacter maritimus]RDC59369.1 Mechanosensitive channel MscK [Alteripontixanthobacter maritimus]
MTSPASIASPSSPAPTPSPTGEPAEQLRAGDTVTLVPTEQFDEDGNPIEPVIPTPEQEAPVEEPVAASEGIKDAVTNQNETAGGIIETFDAMAFRVGETRISLWDALVVILVIAAVVTFAWLATKAAHWVLKRITRLDIAQRLLAEKLLTMGVWGLAILIGIDLLGIDLTALAFFGGAFGLAIGFGLQKTFGNLIAGIILLMDRSIKPGDVIAIADQAGVSTFGQIRKIGIRAVSLTTRDQKEYLIPNENLMINQVENWSYSSKNVRMQVPVGVSYNCDLHLAEKLMLEAAKSVRRVSKMPPPTIWLDAYGDSSVNFVIHCWITDPEEGIGNVKSEVLKSLWDKFAEAGVEIPFPQRDINLRGNEQFEQLIAAITQRMEERGNTPAQATETKD